MPGNANSVNFFIINASNATSANNFPAEGVPGCLISINLYGQHLIQKYLTNNNQEYRRTITNYDSGGSFTEWTKLS